MTRFATRLCGAVLTLAACVGPFAGPAAAQISDDVVRIGVLTDLSGPYADSGGRGSCGGGRDGGEGFRRDGAGQAGRDRLGRPPEQAGRGIRNRPALVRRRQGRCRRRPAGDGDRARRPGGRQGEEPHGDDHRGGDLRPHRQTCSPVRSHWTDDTHALTAGTARAVFERGGNPGTSSPSITPSATPCRRRPPPSSNRSAARWSAPRAPPDQHRRLFLLPAQAQSSGGRGGVLPASATTSPSDQAGRRVRPDGGARR